MRIFARARAVWLACAALAAVVSRAQTQSPEFEVASVKPANGGPEGVWNEGSHERVRMLNLTLKSIVANAYNLKDYAVDGPAWIDSARFDIVAKIPPEVAKLSERQRWQQIRAMSQRMLADRFKLSVHRDTRELPVYALEIAKGGVKLEKTGEPSNDWVSAQVRRGHISAKQMPMVQLVAILTGTLERPVIDSTDFRDVFDIELDWSDDAAPARAAPDTIADKPSLFTALQEQAGLKLVPRKSPIPVLVVDHAQQPSEN